MRELPCTTSLKMSGRTPAADRPPLGCHPAHVLLAQVNKRCLAPQVFRAASFPKDQGQLVSIKKEVISHQRGNDTAFPRGQTTFVPDGSGLEHCVLTGSHFKTYCSVNRSNALKCMLSHRGLVCTALITIAVRLVYFCMAHLSHHKVRAGARRSCVSPGHRGAQM